MSFSHDSDLKLDRDIFWHEIYAYFLVSLPVGKHGNKMLKEGLRGTCSAVISGALNTVPSDIQSGLFQFHQLHLQCVCLPLTLRDMKCLVVCPFGCSFSSSCCQIQWIVTRLLNLCCCMTVFIRMKSPVGLKWSPVSQWQEQWQQVLAKNTSGRERKSKYACAYHFAHWHSSQGSWGKKAAKAENGSYLTILLSYSAKV